MPARTKKPIPFSFVFDLLEPLPTHTRAMFGCTAVYRDEVLVLVLREKDSHVRDNGVWIATTHEHHASLKREFPSMRTIELLGSAPTAWQVLPADALDFEAAVERLCELVKAGDSRVGKLPKAKKKRKKR